MNPHFLLLIILVVINLAVISFAVAFFKGALAPTTAITAMVAMGVGVLGVFMIIIATSRLKNVFKGCVICILAAATILVGMQFLPRKAPVKELQCALLITDINDEDVMFAEYWFPNAEQLNAFISRVPWYMGEEAVKDRREMIDYYYTVKAEENEYKKEIVKRYHVNVPPAQATGQLLAYISERREGALAVDTNPRYIITGARAVRKNEEEEKP